MHVTRYKTKNWNEENNFHFLDWVIDLEVSSLKRTAFFKKANKGED